MQGISGLLNPEKPFTTLAREVVGLTRVICEGTELQQVPYWCVNDGGYYGKPTRFGVHGRKMYIWPIPDRVYRVDLHWNGNPGYDCVLFDCTPEWMEMYERERAVLGVVF